MLLQIDLDQDHMNDMKGIWGLVIIFWGVNIVLVSTTENVKNV